MRHLSKFEFLNLLGIWLFQHVFVYERKDIPFYQFPAKADPSVRLFCFPSAQSRDSDRNNNYPSPPPPIYILYEVSFLPFRYFLPPCGSGTRYVFSTTPPDLSPTRTTDPWICCHRRFFLSTSSYSLRILFFSPPFSLLERRKGRKEEKALEMEGVDYCTSVFNRINIFNRSVGGGNILGTARDRRENWPAENGASV